MSHRSFTFDIHGLLQSGYSLVDVQIHSLAMECKISPAQLLLSWAVQRGTSVVPKTVQEPRLEENRQSFRLNNAVMHTVNQLAEVKGHVRFLDPRNHIGFDMFDESDDQPTLEDEQ